MQDVHVTPRQTVTKPVWHDVPTLKQCIDFVDTDRLARLLTYCTILAAGVVCVPLWGASLFRVGGHFPMA
jgi:hypothetical protein